MAEVEARSAAAAVAYSAGAVIVPTIATADRATTAYIGAARGGVQTGTTTIIATGTAGDGGRVEVDATSDVTAVVKAGGKLYSAKKEVKVTIGGCGG